MAQKLSEFQEKTWLTPFKKKTYPIWIKKGSIGDFFGWETYKLKPIFKIKIRSRLSMPFPLSLL